jgi:hypothetical protein
MPANTSNHPRSGGPKFLTVKEAAARLGGGYSPWVINKLCRDGKIESRWHSRRRLVVAASLDDYADSLPTERQESA